MAELLDAAVVVRVPLRTRFRGVTAREAVLLRGPAGWGEFAPFTEYADAESARWLAAAVEAAWYGWPPARRPDVAVNATVPAVAPADVAGVLARFPGCTTAKVKVGEPGQGLQDDVDRVAEVRAVMGPAARLRVDANGAWSPAQALVALTRLARYDLEYAEQPCPDVPALAALRRHLAAAGLAVPVAADESVRRAEDPFAVAAAGAADLAVVKVAPMGGVAAVLAVAARLAAEHDLEVVVSSALDTSVGIAAGVAAAAALPGEPRACGLGTAGLLARDVTSEPLLARGGRLPARPAAPEADLARHGGLAVTPERDRWWRDRLARCHPLLPGAT